MIAPVFRHATIFPRFLLVTLRVQIGFVVYFYSLYLVSGWVEEGVVPRVVEESLRCLPAVFSLTLVINMFIFLLLFFPVHAFLVQSGPMASLCGS